jgi:DNA-binding PadR family transcriptional regulator
MLPVEQMSSTTRLLVLGVVRIFQPVHGYEVRRELITWRAQEWASIKPGSIYNALKTLSREGFLEVVGTDQVGGRPERTTYQLTSAGMEEFRNLLREEWWTVRALTDPVIAAIAFIDAVPREEAIAALEHRMAQAQGIVRHMEFAIDAHDGVDSPFHVREMMRLMNARLRAEVDWARQFIARLRAGEYTTFGDPPWKPASELAKEREQDTKGAKAKAKAGPLVTHGSPGGRTATGEGANGAHRSAPRSASRSAGPVSPGPTTAAGSRGADRRNGRPRSDDAVARRATRRANAPKRGRVGRT